MAALPRLVLHEGQILTFGDGGAFFNENLD